VTTTSITATASYNIKVTGTLAIGGMSSSVIFLVTLKWCDTATVTPSAIAT